MAARPSRCPQPTIRRPTGVARTSIESDQGFAADGQREPDYRDRDYRDVPTRCRMRLVGEFSPASRSQHSENDSGQRESGDRQDVTALEFWRGDGVVNKNAGRSGGGRGGATPRQDRPLDLQSPVMSRRRRHVSIPHMQRLAARRTPPARTGINHEFGSGCARRMACCTRNQCRNAPPPINAAVARQVTASGPRRTTGSRESMNSRAATPPAMSASAVLIHAKNVRSLARVNR